MLLKKIINTIIVFLSIIPNIYGLDLTNVTGIQWYHNPGDSRTITMNDYTLADQGSIHESTSDYTLADQGGIKNEISKQSL
ncbi:hypothetical protein [Francisella frigiditurris]|uniref:Uncharacterized protein n=1 Tax=Francisella frigiditurris TaxID=1542390 RepID=A0A1J0KRS6_9GAMM|nr:hypothetical protein [Francisella frigiditurris]APC96350.1 hypothetical protein KX01_1260 [Francisella frigiditurris]